MFLLDGKTGELLDTVSLEANVEASPAVFGNMVVVGTRARTFSGLEINNSN
jgi:outer membrane protein assembly factor BamB